MRDGGKGNEGVALRCVGRSAWTGGGGFNEKDCFRHPRVIRNLWEDLPCSFPILFEFNKERKEKRSRGGDFVGREEED